MDKLKKIKNTKNTGVDIKPIAKTDFFAGALTYQEVLPTGDWSPYLPIDENQKLRTADSMACVSYSALNSVECQLNFLLKSGRIPKFVESKMVELGFLIEGKFNFSDRFLAKMSSTTTRGNFPPKVWDAIRHYGLLPEADWPKVETWSEYYRTIPEELKTKAKEFLKYFNIDYEWVVVEGKKISLENLHYHLKQAPLQLCSPTCPPWAGGVILACGEPASHATMIYGCNQNWIGCYDHYEPFLKKLAVNYPLTYVMKGIVSIKTQEITIDMVRHAWVADPVLRETFPAPKFVHKEIPHYPLLDWARDYGVYDHEQFFGDKDFAEKIIQVEGTQFFFLVGPGGGAVENQEVLENAEIEVLPVEKAKDILGILPHDPLIAPHLEKPKKKFWLWRFLKEFFNL